MKMYNQKTKEFLKIVQEEMAESPREWDNLGLMVCFHKDYMLGDEQKEISKEDFNSWDEMEAYLHNHYELVIRLRLYDHSGISISASSGYPFNCRWDSMTVGFIVVSKETILKEYGKKKLTKKLLARARETLLNEVKVYNYYLQGAVYGFVKYKINTCKECGTKHKDKIDSCYGFYGYDFKENGLYDGAGIDLTEWDVINE